MTLPPLIIRPEPGASATATRATAMGLTAIAAPLFAVAPIHWSPPLADSVDALLLTSANAARLGGDDLQHYRDLPCLCVGDATAEAAREAGLSVAWTGETDGKSALVAAADQGYHQLLWLCGQQHTPLVHPRITLTVVPVYEAAPCAPSAQLIEALSHPAIILLHSQRAAWALADLVSARAHLGVIAISPGVAAVAGEGWAWVHWPEFPRDQDMLELVGAMCQNPVP